ncbi:hypothetical protein BCEP4_850004 [Burkholderia cepacia]|nr:hypothetical protein BCEP4_850004 [Burkholderia cepacia]
MRHRSRKRRTHRAADRADRRAGPRETRRRRVRRRNGSAGDVGRQRTRRRGRGDQQRRHRHGRRHPRHEHAALGAHPAREPVGRDPRLAAVRAADGRARHWRAHRQHRVGRRVRAVARPARVCDDESRRADAQRMHAGGARGKRHRRDGRVPRLRGNRNHGVDAIRGRQCPGRSAAAQARDEAVPDARPETRNRRAGDGRRRAAQPPRRRRRRRGARDALRRPLHAVARPDDRPRQHGIALTAHAAAQGDKDDRYRRLSQDQGPAREVRLQRHAGHLGAERPGQHAHHQHAEPAVPGRRAVVLPRVQQGLAADHRRAPARRGRRLPAAGGRAFALARRRAEALLRPARDRHEAVHAKAQPAVHARARRTAARAEDRPHAFLAAAAARGDRVARAFLRLSRQLGAQRARARRGESRSDDGRPAALARRGGGRAPHGRVRHLPAHGRHLSGALRAHGVRDPAAALLHHDGREVHVPARPGRRPLPGFRARVVARLAARAPAVVLEGDRRGAALFQARLYAASRRLDRTGARVPRPLAGRTGGRARRQLGHGEGRLTGFLAGSTGGARRNAYNRGFNFPEVPRWP